MLLSCIQSFFITIGSNDDVKSIHDGNGDSDDSSDGGSSSHRNVNDEIEAKGIAWKMVMTTSTKA